MHYDLDERETDTLIAALRLLIVKWPQHERMKQAKPGRHAPLNDMEVADLIDYLEK